MAKHQPSEVRRAQIFEAALKVCAEKGYHATRINDIVARAGLSKGSLYHHFKSKEDVFLGLFENMLAEFKTLMQVELEENPSPRDGLMHVFERFADLFRQDLGLMGALMEFYLLGMRNDEFKRQFLQHYKGLADVVTRFIERGQEMGQFSRRHDPAKVAWLLLTGGDGVVFVHVVLNQEAEGIEAMLELMRLVLRGLGPEGDKANV